MTHGYYGSPFGVDPFAPSTPPLPMTPPAPTMLQVLERLCDHMERVETLLERIVEQLNSRGR